MKPFKIKVVKNNTSYTGYVLKHDEVVFSSENNPTHIIAARKAGEFISNINNTSLNPEVTNIDLTPIPTSTLPIIKQTAAVPVNQVIAPVRKCCGRR